MKENRVSNEFRQGREATFAALDVYKRQAYEDDIKAQEAKIAQMEAEIKKKEAEEAAKKAAEEAYKMQQEAMESDDGEGIVQDYLDRLLPDNWASMDIYQRRAFLGGGAVSYTHLDVYKRQALTSIVQLSRTSR